MSKPFRLFSVGMFAVACVCVSAVWVRGQVAETTARIDLAKLPVVKVEVQVGRRRNVSFLRSIAGVDKAAQRIAAVNLSHGSTPVAFKRLTDGEFLADADFDTISYEVDLSPMNSRSSSAHVSWFSKDIGVLMGADLLPQLPNVTGSITFTGIPPRFEIFSTEKAESAARFTARDPENAVFYIGSAWRREAVFRYKESAVWITSGQWQFGDADATTMIADILIQYQNVFGDPEPLPNVNVGIVKFPMPTEAGAWEADTRGRNVLIVSSDMPFRTQSLQRLHEQLRHELFHLWIPNGVNLTGNYDWFYEGFALYESLKLAVRLNRISFADFLDTLSRAHTIDSAQSQRISLIQASANRFGGSNTQVYARGMLVAFLTDLTMLEASRGKRSVEDLLRDLYAKHGKPAEPADGNAAVIEMLKTRGVAGVIVEKYIDGAEKIEWTNELSAAGIEDSDPGVLTTLRVKEKLSGGQKAMLDKLGYNNWRKLSVPSK